MSKNAKDVIKNYLDEMAKRDETFAKAYANEKKSMDKCFDYIVSTARKRGNAVCMTDDEVFGLAVHYYVEGDIKDVKMPADFKEAKVSEKKEEEQKKSVVRKAKKQGITGMGYLFDF